MAGSELRQSNEGSEVDFDYHIEAAFSELRPAHLGLFCLRADHEGLARTTLISAQRAVDALSSETRAGKPRIEAFKNLEARTKNDDVRALVAMLVQTDRFGTSVSQALRTFAEVARTRRRQRAEERAAKVGVKMVFPLVLCLFPALYVVTPAWNIRS